jgi:5-methylcytosine-specific restriction endonuclease McrA
MHWIRDERRLAIYMRDGLACVYCGSSVETGCTLTLDHLRPVKSGGTNKETNLVTACLSCNCSRGTRPVAEFADAVSIYLGHDVDSQAILNHVYDCARRRIDVDAAKAMIAARGSAAQVVAAITQEKINA